MQNTYFYLHLNKVQWTITAHWLQKISVSGPSCQQRDLERFTAQEPQEFMLFKNLFLNSLKFGTFWCEEKFCYL